MTSKGIASTGSKAWGIQASDTSGFLVPYDASFLVMKVYECDHLGFCMSQKGPLNRLGIRNTKHYPLCYCPTCLITSISRQEYHFRILSVLGHVILWFQLSCVSGPHRRKRGPSGTHMNWKPVGTLGQSLSSIGELPTKQYKQCTTTNAVNYDLVAWGATLVGQIDELALIV